ncbi:putative ran-binding protein 3 [Apostichopus japonicus]|uniref:Putative ran-binding protein 3 n=1 Tax=Stichopus japonicus TaxID=307972 RepID=A0A2G8KIT7_STIJA|nr:putative ran-binding protein 3 [Apostichopus japonicus]
MADQATVSVASNDNQTDNPKGTKRPLEDSSDTNAVKKQETEAVQSDIHEPSEDDKTTFRLNPPTLIHGVAKPAPKTEDEDSDGSKEKPFLRPSLFGSASSNPFLMAFSKSAADSTSEESESLQKEDESNTSEQADSEKRKVNFLKLSTGETDRDVGFGVFGTFSDSQLHTVDFSEKENAKGQNGDGQNYFLQFSQPAPKREEKKPKEEFKESKKGVSSTDKQKFVFGQNMNARVTSPSKQEGELQIAGQYVFGQNLSDRVKKEEIEQDTEQTETEQSAKSLAENAKELESAKEKSRVKFEEVQLFTGEEGEENVLQAQCKLHLFQVDKQAWVERGRGLLRLNDRVPSDYNEQMESRIIMRAQGSLRVLLNAKIWSEMIAEKVSTKNIRISAVDGDSGTVKIYLITHLTMLTRYFRHRLQNPGLKHRETTTKISMDEESNKEEEPDQAEDSSNTATCDSYEGNEGNEAEIKRQTAGKTQSEDSKTTSTTEVTSSSKDTSD